MGVTTQSTVDVTELECEGRLLRFKKSVAVEVQPGEDAHGLWIPLFQLGAAGRDEAEAWEMLADLVISAYEDYRGKPKIPLHKSAITQRKALFAAVSGYYIRQSA